MSNTIQTGIEIECVLNERLVSVSRGGYHGNRRHTSKGLRSWFPESDSSISMSSPFEEWARPTEFVSKVFKDKASMTKALNQLKKYISQNGQYELNEVLHFNDTTGSHIHISTDVTISQKASWETMKEVRQMFLDKIGMSEIESKEKIIQQYFRNYAKKSTKGNWRKKSRRYSEFNSSSEARNQGFEWRSINMVGIQTWKEFDEFFKIVWDCIDYMVRNTHKWESKQNIYPRPKMNEVTSNIVKLRVPLSNEITETIKLGVNEEVIIYNTLRDSERVNIVETPNSSQPSPTQHSNYNSGQGVCESCDEYYSDCICGEHC